MDDPEKTPGAPWPLRWSCQTAQKQSWADVLGVTIGRWQPPWVRGDGEGAGGFPGAAAVACPRPAAGRARPGWLSLPRAPAPGCGTHPSSHPSGSIPSTPPSVPPGWDPLPHGVAGSPSPTAPLSITSFLSGPSPPLSLSKTLSPAGACIARPGAGVRQPRSSPPASPLRLSSPVLSDRKCDSKPSNFFFFFFFPWVGLFGSRSAGPAILCLSSHDVQVCMGTLGRRALISGIECDPPPGFSPALPGWDRPVGLTARHKVTHGTMGRLRRGKAVT